MIQPCFAMPWYCSLNGSDRRIWTAFLRADGRWPSRQRRRAVDSSANKLGLGMSWNVIGGILFWLCYFFLRIKSSGRFFEILLISVVTSAEELGRRWSHALPPQSKGDLVEFVLIGCFYFLHSFISVFSLSQVTGNFTQSQSKHFCSFDSFDQVMEDKRKKLVIEQANVTACSSVTIRQIFPKPSKSWWGKTTVQICQTVKAVKAVCDVLQNR